ncbi:MAG: enoyl-CoA hydratase/isomerase family protein [Pseudomonadales bacterium]|nr:enoyl-CoA hydratase/isomerase family protein [Pseudomonadales bacterium]
MKSIRYEKDDQNIVHLVFDNPTESANLMNADFRASLAEAVAKLKGESELAGVILRSAKSTFFAGADLKELIAAREQGAEAMWAVAQPMKEQLRAIETLGKPVVAAINGAALGGGWEICLCAHHRIALDDAKIPLGLPEVTLGLLPGAGGVVRMVRLLGIEASLPFLLEGQQFNPVKGKELGLVHALAATPEEMLDQARAWIKANPDARQPYDQKGYKIPGGTPASPALGPKLMIAPAMVREKTRGVMPAPEAILSAAVESTQVDIDSAMRIETRYFVSLVLGTVARNMINTFWFQLNEIKAGVGRPKDVPRAKLAKVGVLGAGMMGAGIAHACATRGLEVVLKDVDLAAAEKGKGYSAKILGKQLGKGKLTQEKHDATLARIVPTASAAELAGCDLVIEAVFEDRELKARVTQEAESQLGATAIFASNTSTLPITGLAAASARPANFIGLHFFSPADRMPLVEIICGRQTSPETLARSYDFVQQIGKTPVIVNDSRGFFTSRVFGTFCQEGIAMLREGVPAATIENGALLAGFPVGPLAVSDEVSLTLMSKIRHQTIADLRAEGKEYVPHQAESVIDWMLEQNRAGKAAGKGFYEYPEGAKKHLWPELAKRYGRDETPVPLTDIKERLLFVQAIETVRCVDEGVLSTSRDANIGSIFGIGFPAWTGGVLQYINGYGLPAFVSRARELAEAYGDRFLPPASLIERAGRNVEF